MNKVKSTRLATIEQILRTSNLPVYQYQNAIRSIYRSHVTKYRDMTFLPLSIREKIVDALGEELLVVSPSHSSPSDQCVKLLFDLRDSQSIETVWMKFRDSSHTSLCISSQVGCALKCSFCSTGAVGFKRQLSTDEITDQILHFTKAGKSVNTISFMGMGEALQNPRVFDALSVLTSKDLMGLSPRRINVSTVGVIPGIERLTRDFPNVNLAFSLHSPFVDERSELVPANRTYPLPEILRVLDQHAKQTRRKIILAYLLLPGLNDTEFHAKKIVDIITGMSSGTRHLYHLNILRYNPAAGIDTKFQRTAGQHLSSFIKHLDGQIPYTIRQSFGLDIDAACGQLYTVSRKALKHMKEQ